MKQKILVGIIIMGLFGMSGVSIVHAQAENPSCPSETNLLEMLDMTREELREALESGQTMEEIFEAAGLDYAAFIEEAAANQLACIDQALSEGKITESQAERMTTAVEKALEEGKLFFQGHRRAKQFALRKIEFASFENIAEVLGMTPEALKEALQDGQTLEEITNDLGVDLDELFTEWVETQIEDINQALENGNLTEEQAQKLLDRMEQLIEEGFDYENWNPFEKGIDRAKAILRSSKELVKQTLDALEMTATDLRQAIEDGQTLEEIAQEKGVDLDEIYHSWIEDQINQVNQAVEDGKISQDQADEVIECLNEQLEEGFPSNFLGRVHRQFESSREGRFPGDRERPHSDGNDD